MGKKNKKNKKGAARLDDFPEKNNDQNASTEGQPEKISVR